MKSYVAYIRVSTVKQGQHGSSLQEQRDAIQAFAQRSNLTIVQWYEDMETAAKKGRTEFVRMMAALEKGSFTGVILHKIDRGARNLWDWAHIQELVEAGVEVHFAHDNLDLKSRGGRLAADIQAVVAADYVRNLRDEVRKGLRGRFKQGLYPFKAPPGYMDMGRGRAKAIDPIKGPIVAFAFKAYAFGTYSYSQLSEELFRRGLSKRNGKPLGLNGISAILRNPFYMGLLQVRISNEVFPGIHTPLVDVATFKRVQDVIDGRINQKIIRHDFTYRKLLKCGVCNGVLTGEIQKKHTYYRCHTRHCLGGSIREETVDAAIAEAFAGVSLGEAEVRQMLPYLAELGRNSNEERDRQCAGLKLRLAAIGEKEHRLVDAFLDQTIDRESYEARKRASVTEALQVKEALAALEANQEEDLSAKGENFFELVKVLFEGPKSENVELFRAALEMATSNRQLVGKKLYVTLRFPFQEIASEPCLRVGCDPREILRTKATAADFHRERAVIISAYLRTWQVDLGAVRPQRRVNPNWFKKKSANDNEQREAA